MYIYVHNVYRDAMTWKGNSSLWEIVNMQWQAPCVTHAAGQKSCGRHTVRLKIERPSEKVRADLRPNIQLALLNGELKKYRAHCKDLQFEGCLYVGHATHILGNKIACDYGLIAPTTAPT